MSSSCPRVSVDGNWTPREDPLVQGDALGWTQGTNCFMVFLGGAEAGPVSAEARSTCSVQVTVDGDWQPGDEVPPLP